MKAIVDINIIIDALASRAPFNKDAEKIILLAAEKTIRAAVTASTASDIYYLMRKHLKSPLLASKELKKLFSIVDIVPVERADCLKAFDTGIKDYEDSLLAVCAAHWKASCIITRNVKDFAGAEVKAVSPGEFLKTLESRRAK
jgi:predicted nucleic acid-binding protein